MVGHKKTLISLAIIVILVAVFGICYHYNFNFSQKIIHYFAMNNTNVSADITPFDDSDVAIMVDTASDNCKNINAVVAPSAAELSLLEGYLAGGTASPSVAVQNLLNGHIKDLTTYFTDSSWVKDASAVVDGKSVCNLQNLYPLSLFQLVQAKELALAKKTDQTKTAIISVLNTSQTIIDNARSAVTFSLGLRIKSVVIELIATLENDKLADEATYKTILQKYADSVTGYKNALQNEYSSFALLIDDVADGKNLARVSLNQNIKLALSQDKSTVAFQPNKTKLAFYTLVKDALASADAPCSATSTNVAEYNTHKDTENYIGNMIILSQLPDFATLNKTRCDLESKINGF